MSWASTLSDTYDQALKLDIAPKDMPIPIYHTVQTAHINIVISGDGDFKDAKVLGKSQKIILPATDDSAGKTSGEAPHALAEKLQYVAADYAEYGGKKPAYFEGYAEQLRRWCASEFSHPSAEAVLEYISKKSVIADLIRQKIVRIIVRIDDARTLLTEWLGESNDQPSLIKILTKKKGCFDQGDALVCWTVETPGDPNADTWLDPTLQESWTGYEKAKTACRAVCFVSGDEQAIALNHPARLRHSGDKAKIISSNDLTGFTFRGRFTDTKESIKEKGLQGMAVGGRTSHKAHNALRWLIDRQRFKNGGGDQPIIVAWAVSGEEIPDPLSATSELFDLNDFSESEENHQPNSEFQEVPDHTIDLGYNFAQELNKYMKGYHAKLIPTDTIAIIAIDSATRGRMAITYYRESLPTEYLNQIYRWHTDLAWFQRVSKEIAQQKGKAWALSAPSPRVIMNAVYGNTLSDKDSLKKTFYGRLMPLIIEGAPIPWDFIQSAFNRARNPVVGKKEWEWEWEQCLGATCSLYRGFYIRHPHDSERKGFTMSLEKSNTSRDYLYGRLLAIADRLEEFALRPPDKTDKEDRPTRATTAIRLLQRFSDRPYSTWLNIFKQLNPYICQLQTRRYAGFLTNRMKELDEVMGLFDTEQFKQDTNLTCEFLLGFHAQRLALRSPKKSDENTSESTEE